MSIVQRARCCMASFTTDHLESARATSTRSSGPAGEQGFAQRLSPLIPAGGVVAVPALCAAPELAQRADNMLNELGAVRLTPYRKESALSALRISATPGHVPYTGVTPTSRSLTSAV